MRQIVWSLPRGRSLWLRANFGETLHAHRHRGHYSAKICLFTSVWTRTCVNGHNNVQWDDSRRQRHRVLCFAFPRGVVGAGNCGFTKANNEVIVKISYHASCSWLQLYLQYHRLSQQGNYNVYCHFSWKIHEESIHHNE